MICARSAENRWVLQKTFSLRNISNIRRFQKDAFQATPEERRANLVRLLKDPAISERQKNIIHSAIIQERVLFDKVRTKHTAACDRFQRFKEYILFNLEDNITTMCAKEVETLGSSDISKAKKISVNFIAFLNSLKGDLARLRKQKSSTSQEGTSEEFDEEVLKVLKLSGLKEFSHLGWRRDATIKNQLLIALRQTRLHCKHRFHTACLNTHFATQYLTMGPVSARCPLCRAEFDNSDMKAIQGSVTLVNILVFLNKFCDLISENGVYLLSIRASFNRFFADQTRVTALASIFRFSTAEMRSFLPKFKELIDSLTLANLRDQGLLSLIQTKFPGYSLETLACDTHHLLKAIDTTDQLFQDISASQAPWSPFREPDESLKRVYRMFVDMTPPQLPADNYALAFRMVAHNEELALINPLRGNSAILAKLAIALNARDAAFFRSQVEALYIRAGQNRFQMLSKAGLLGLLVIAMWGMYWHIPF